MATIKSFDGNKLIDVEVSEDFAAQYAEMEHKEYLVNRKETRRHQSLDKSLEHGFDVPDDSINVEDQAERNERRNQLCKAMDKLSPEQKELLKLVYFDGIAQTEIARRQGVTKKAINNRLARILHNLKKLLS